MCRREKCVSDLQIIYLGTILESVYLRALPLSPSYNPYTPPNLVGCLRLLGRVQPEGQASEWPDSHRLLDVDQLVLVQLSGRLPAPSEVAR